MQNDAIITEVCKDQVLINFKVISTLLSFLFTPVSIYVKFGCNPLRHGLTQITDVVRRQIICGLLCRSDN